MSSAPGDLAVDPVVPQWIHQPHASPLVGALQVRERGDGRLLASMTVDPAEPVLAGHFPGFAIFPGVCLVECAHQSALLALAADTPLRPVLAAVESARFLAPVFPGDEVWVETATQPHDEGWRCSARLTVRRPGQDGQRDAAKVRLRYCSGIGGAGTDGQEPPGALG